MKRVLAIVFLAVIVIGAWYLFFKKDNEASIPEPKAEALAVMKHSSEFNEKVAAVINAYLDMKTAFANADSPAVKTHAQRFISAIDSIPLNEFQKDDSTILPTVRQQLSELKANTNPILQEPNLQQMRHDFSMVSENLYPFLKTIGYEGQKLYWQNCPMAFGDDKPANWLSNTSEIINPYLGKNHPEYKSSMLHCGENMDSIFAK